MPEKPNPLLAPLYFFALTSLILLVALVFSFQLPKIIQEQMAQEVIRRSTNQNTVIIEK